MTDANADALTDYERKIVQAFRDVCAEHGGASPHEVTSLMRDRSELSPLDNVLDIAKIMRGLRNRGSL